MHNFDGQTCPCMHISAPGAKALLLYLVSQMVNGKIFFAVCGYLAWHQISHSGVVLTRHDFGSKIWNQQACDEISKILSRGEWVSNGLFNSAVHHRAIDRYSQAGETPNKLTFLWAVWPGALQNPVYGAPLCLEELKGPWASSLVTNRGEAGAITGHSSLEWNRADAHHSQHCDCTQDSG